MLYIYTRKTLTQHGKLGGAQTLKTGQGARTQGYTNKRVQSRRARHAESKTACGIYIWPSRATVTGSPVLGVDGHHAQPRRTRAVRVSLQLARRLSLCAWHEAGGGREQEEAVGALRPEVDDARLARP